MNTISEAIRAAAKANDRPEWSPVLSDKHYSRYLGGREWLSGLADSELRTFLLLVACALED